MDGALLIDMWDFPDVSEPMRSYRESLIEPIAHRGIASEREQADDYYVWGDETRRTPYQVIRRRSR